MRYKWIRYGGEIFDITQEDIDADLRFTIAVKTTIYDIKKFWSSGLGLEESEYIYATVD